MVTSKNDAGSYRYVPAQPMTEAEFKEKLERLVLLLMYTCVPDEIKRAKASARKGRATQIRRTKSGQLTAEMIQ